MQQHKNYYSIIDIGSNSMRLVIYVQENSGRLHEVENVKSVARLRKYLKEDNMLSQSGIRILIRTLKSFKEVVETYELKDFICVATSTIREAKNREEIKKFIQHELKWEIRILTEKEEAYYGYLSVVNSTSITEGITVDIGGGSTEVTYFKDRMLRYSHSFPFGALTLKDFFSTGESKEKATAKLCTFLRKQFKTLDWLPDHGIPLIGIGGSARNIAEMTQHRKKYPLAGLHQYQMEESDLAKITQYLSKLTPKELEKVEGLSMDRVDTILPASLVFYSLFQMIHADSFILSRKGLRDGVFYEKLAKKSAGNLYPDVLGDSISELIFEYNLDVEQIDHTKFLTEKLYHSLKGKGLGNLTNTDWDMLYLACHVYNLGQYIDSESSSQHTFYLLANRTIDGLMHPDRLKLALIASFKNKAIFKQFINPYKHWFLKKERKKIALLGAMLKFTYYLDATKRQAIEDFEFTTKENKRIVFTFYCNQDCKPEQYQAEKQKKHMEKALKHDIDLIFICSA